MFKYFHNMLKILSTYDTKEDHICTWLTFKHMMYSFFLVNNNDYITYQSFVKFTEPMAIFEYFCLYRHWTLISPPHAPVKVIVKIIVGDNFLLSPMKSKGKETGEETTREEEEETELFDTELGMILPNWNWKRDVCQQRAEVIATQPVGSCCLLITDLSFKGLLCDDTEREYFCLINKNNDNEKIYFPKQRTLDESEYFRSLERFQPNIFTIHHVYKTKVLRQIRDYLIKGRMLVFLDDMNLYSIFEIADYYQIDNLLVIFKSLLTEGQICMHDDVEATTPEPEPKPERRFYTLLPLLS